MTYSRQENIRYAHCFLPSLSPSWCSTACSSFSMRKVRQWRASSARRLLGQGLSSPRSSLKTFQFPATLLTDATRADRARCLSTIPRRPALACRLNQCYRPVSEGSCPNRCGVNGDLRFLTVHDWCLTCVMKCIHVQDAFFLAQKWLLLPSSLLHASVCDQHRRVVLSFLSPDARRPSPSVSPYPRFEYTISSAIVIWAYPAQHASNARTTSGTVSHEAGHLRE